MVGNLIVVRVILNQILSILANQNDYVDQHGRPQKRDELIRIWHKARENSRVQAAVVFHVCRPEMHLIRCMLNFDKYDEVSRSLSVSHLFDH